MPKNKKLFVVSDVHGYLAPLQKALAESGFDPNDDSHTFICCGDLFDEENQNDELVRFIEELKHKILILGDREEELRKIPALSQDLCALIDNMRDYYETENYVFVHGWVPTECYFHYANEDAWTRVRKLGWHEFYGENDEILEKTMVCGHIPTRLAYAFAPDRDLSDSGIYYGNGVIAIDGGVEGCGKINVLILEEACISI